MRFLAPVTLALLLPAVVLTIPIRAAEFVVDLPKGIAAKSATATAAGVKLDVEGKVEGQSVTFSGVLSDTSYDVRITLDDGTVLQGVDLSWQNDEPAQADAGPLTDDDRAQVRSIVEGVADFYNRKDLAALHGDRDRAVGLLRLVRDTDFYAGAGQIVWRIEVWTFKNQAGGWEAQRQQNRIIRRERFKDAAAYEAATRSLRFVPALGGVRVGTGEPRKAVALPVEGWIAARAEAATGK